MVHGRFYFSEPEALELPDLDGGVLGRGDEAISAGDQRLHRALVTLLARQRTQTSAGREVLYIRTDQATPFQLRHNTRHTTRPESTQILMVLS